MDRYEQILQRHKLEEIENNAIPWTDAHWRHQHQFAKLRRVARRHLCRYPTAKRKTDRINWRKVLFEQVTRVKTREVANVANPFRPLCTTKARMLRDNQGAMAR